MPEGHTIHRLARDLSRDLVGHPVTTGARQDRFAEGAHRLDGRTLEETSALGKHLFLHWSDAEILHIHLGLFGKFVRRPRDDAFTSDALRLRLIGPTHAWDLTGAITCAIRTPEVLDEIGAKLGPDPLRPDADPARFVGKVRASRQPIGALLLDQSVIAGVGNVYRAEILHLHGIHPAREGRSLSEAQLLEVWATTVAQLRLGVTRNRIVTVPLDGRRATSIGRSDAVYVYKQEQCRTCGTRVTQPKVDARNMFACPRCQPAPRMRRPKSA